MTPTLKEQGFPRGRRAIDEDKGPLRLSLLLLNGDDGLMSSVKVLSGLKRSPLGSVLFLLLVAGLFSPGAILAAGNARAMFAELCSICHGAGGKGDGPSAAGLNPKPADFSNCQTMETQSEETLFRIIKHGGQSVGRSTVMPGWGEALSDGQIRDLVALIRGLCKK